MKALQLMLAISLAAGTGAPNQDPRGDHAMVLQTTLRASPLPIQGELPSLGGATGWLNSQPLTPDGLRGKVVLVEFWTSTCINWLRPLSHVRAWSEKYRDHGLVVIGVHTPEFPFEKNVENVRRAAND